MRAAPLLCAALVTVAARLRGAAAYGDAITMPLLSHAEVHEYHQERRRRLQEAGVNPDAQQSLDGRGRRQLMHVAMDNKKIMEGDLQGNTMPLGYFYTKVRVGTPGQEFTVIVDTGSSLLAIPCDGCKRCGKHMNAYFHQSSSSTFIDGCKNIPGCSSCSGNQCTYSTHFVEGSSINGHVVRDSVGMLINSTDTPQFTSPAIFGCQMSETGLFRAQMADGIMGLGFGKYHTLLDSLVVEHKIKNTLSFCTHRSGGYLQLGADPPTGKDVLVTPLHPHQKYYVVRILDMKIGKTGANLGSSQYNNGHGAIIDSGTSLCYFPRTVHQRLLNIFQMETRALKLPRAERIDGADCWRTHSAPGGISSFPSFSVEFEGAGLVEFGPIHYIFNHPQVINPTHYCYGILDNGPTGLVLGSLFMRHIFMTLDREQNKVHMKTDHCGDIGLHEIGKGMKVSPPKPLPKGTCFGTKQGTDFNGGDLTSIVTANVAGCCASCYADTECKGFSFVKHGGICWLKHSVNGEVKREGVTSGTKDLFAPH